MIQPNEEMLDQLEPAVTRIARPLLHAKIAAGESTVNAETTAAMFSQAISLRRIADALAGIGENAFTKPLNQYGENIGECIEGQFNRSGR